MKITVINGSPKGSKSNTIYSFYYIQKQFPQHIYNLFNVGKEINKIDRNEEGIYDKIVQTIKDSDLILWVAPVYVFSVPSQLIRFVEMLYSRNDEKIFEGKYASFITTSLHIMDNFACDYMRAVSEELGMNFVASLTAETNDILSKEERKKLLVFANYIINATEKKIVIQKHFLDNELNKNKTAFALSNSFSKINTAKKIVILTDNDKNNNINHIVETFSGFFITKPEIVNMSTLEVKGGCYGCLFCGFDNICIYDFGGKDKFTEFFNDNIKTADIIVFAFTLSDGIIPSKMKQFLDRVFFNNHTQPMLGKQLAYIVSGRLHKLAFIRPILEGFAEIQAANPVGIFSDENDNLDSSLYALAEDAVFFSNEQYVKPLNFIGVGSHKILRDNVYGYYRKILCADYFYFRKNKMFDFPKRNFFTWLQVSTILILNKSMLFRKIYYKSAHKKAVKCLDEAINK